MSASNPTTTSAVIRYFLRPYRRSCAVVIGLTCVTSLLESVNLIALFPVCYALSGSLMAPSASRAVQRLTALLQALPFRDPVLAASLLLVAVVMAKSVIILLRERVIAVLSGRVAYDLKNRMFARYAHAPYEAMLDAKQGALLHTCIMTPQKVAILFLRAPQLVAESLTVAAITVVLFGVWPWATLALLVIGALYNWLTHDLAHRISYATARGRSAASAEQIVVAQEFLSGVRQIFVACVQQPWQRRFEDVNRRHRDLSIQDYSWLAVPKPLMETTAMLLLIGGALLVRQQGAGAFAARLPLMSIFAIALVRLLPSLTNIGRLRMEIMGLLPEAELAYRALTEPLPERPAGRQPFVSLAREIRFEDVTFAHRGRHALLRHLSVAFERGRTTALIGPSGAGKSTMVNLLLGVFVPVTGRITVDGVPLQEYRLDTWLRQIGFVSQDPFIVHATVADNIRFGRPGYSSEDIERAARLAQAHAFIQALPHGYETLVGERGMKLSGGQQQRVAIARAMLSHPEILIFDEATSHLDAEAEQQVQAAIDQIAHDRTVILIAHRFSTVRNAHKIIVLDEGRIVEEGRHDDLVGGQGRYYQLVTAGQR